MAGKPGEWHTPRRPAHWLFAVFMAHCGKKEYGYALRSSKTQVQGHKKITL